MNTTLREGIQATGAKCLDTIDQYIKGDIGGSDKITVAMRMVNMSLKVEHMNQIKSNSDRSFALRLLPFLPKDVDRDEYVRITQPQLQPLLLGKPEIKKIE